MGISKQVRNNTLSIIVHCLISKQSVFERINGGLMVIMYLTSHGYQRSNSLHIWI